MVSKIYLCEDCAMSLYFSGYKIYPQAFFTSCKNPPCNKMAQYHIRIRSKISTQAHNL